MSAQKLSPLKSTSSRKPGLAGLLSLSPRGHVKVDDGSTNDVITRSTQESAAQQPLHDGEGKPNSVAQKPSTLPCHFRFRLWLVMLAIKLLLFPAYRSTDFEVHRNWMAITHSLPWTEWYIEATSEWTLDYPPFFAWFEWALSQAARLVDPQMLVVSNLNYASWGTVSYQRCSVIATELLLVVVVCTSYSRVTGWRGQLLGVAVFALAVCNPGLIIVDHIHFQYNGVLLGLFLASIALVNRGQDLLGGILFAVLVHAKHLFAVAGPVYAVYILRHFCRGPYALTGLVVMAAAVIAITWLSMAPFLAAAQLPQLLSRLFPFQRGLLHAYWAPNFWALYASADKVATALAPRFGPLAHMVERRGSGATGTASMTGGLVGTAQFAVLPQVGSAATLLMTMAAMTPCLVQTWRKPKPGAFLDAIVYACLCSFVFGYHVHEKAILTVTVPMAAGALRSASMGGIYLFLSTVGHYALLPLLYTPAEYPIKVLVCGLYSGATYWLLFKLLSHDAGGGWPHMLSRAEYVYLWGLLPLELYCSALHTLVWGKDVLPFVPLMLTSAYCALGITWVWLRLMVAQLQR